MFSDFFLLPVRNYLYYDSVCSVKTKFDLNCLSQALNGLADLLLVGAGKGLELLATLEEGEGRHRFDLLGGGEILEIVDVDLGVLLLIFRFKNNN